MSAFPLFSSLLHPKGTLLVATQIDTASVNIATKFLEKYKHKWFEVDKGLWKSRNRRNELVMLWLQEEPLLYLNNIDELFKNSYSNILAEIGFYASEVIFLSKHRAASGTPALTVHPIGSECISYYSSYAICLSLNK